MKKLILTLLCASLALPAFAADEKQAAKPKMEVCFVLDTTGSMGGLIQGAKDKIWSIANEMVSAKPTPEIRFGLVAYRDKKDAYLTQVTDLSEDIDEIYDKLMKFQAKGGGDTPEAVNHALHDAVAKMSWSESRDVLKIVFLVGDAPPHMDYQDDVKYPQVCQMAMKKDLIINTIQCGRLAGTKEIWEDIASKSEGEYAAILQSGGTVAIKTPFDDEISTLNGKLNSTVVAYGDARQRSFARTKVRNAATSKSEAVADRADYLLKSASSPARGAKVISGDEDLVAQVEEGKLDLDEIEEEKLPDSMKKMSEEERKAHIGKLTEERKALQTKMKDLVKQRGEFITKEKKRLATEGKSDGFDMKVKATLRAQAKKKGIDLGKTD